MNKIDLIEKIETEITNGSTDTMELTQELIHDLFSADENVAYNEIWEYDDNGIDGMLINLKRISDSDNIVQIEWETTEINSENTLYFYEIS